MNDSNRAGAVAFNFLYSAWHIGAELKRHRKEDARRVVVQLGVNWR